MGTEHSRIELSRFGLEIVKLDSETVEFRGPDVLKGRARPTRRTSLHMHASKWKLPML